MASPEKQDESPKPEEGEKKEENVLRKRLKKFADSNDAQEILSAFEEINEMFKEELVDGQKLYKLLSKKDDHLRVQVFCKTIESKVNKTEFKEEAKSNLKDKPALIVGGGPCGLRTAIELALLDMKVVVVEKRTEFTRNSVLQLWSFLVEDLKVIGFKEFHPEFGLDDRFHVSIRRLQIVLLKICLLLGVEVHLGVEFTDVIKPNKKTGWGASFEKLDESLSALKDFEFEVLIVANGRQNPKVPDVGFDWVTIERKLAIAVAANFENKRTRADLEIDDIGGKSVMRDRDFFEKIKEVTNSDLENLVYIKGETHYFVMTGKRGNLIEKGVLKENLPNNAILDTSNIDRENLKNFVTEIASHCTKNKINLNLIDVNIFEFTSRAHAKKAAILKESKKGTTLMIGLVGDTLKQPFWPEGVGIAHGYFSVFDTVWMVYEWLGLKLPAEEVLQNRKDTYGCLTVITKENMAAVRYHEIDPLKRYAKYRDMKNRPAGAAENVIPEVVNARKMNDDSPDIDETKQKGVSKIAEMFGGQKKKKKKEKDGKKKRRWFPFRLRRKSKTSEKEPKEKKSASSEDVRQGAEGDGELKRGRFRSFRKSFRRSFRRKKREPRVEEVKDDGDVKKEKPSKSKEPEKDADKDKPPEDKP